MSDSAKTNQVWLAGPAAITALASLGIAFVCLPISSEGLLPILSIALLGMVLHLSSMELASFGYLNLAFTLAVLTALAPTTTLGFKAELSPSLQVAGRWASGALVLLLGMLPRLANPPLSQAIAYFGANCLRWLLVGGALVGVYALTSVTNFALLLAAIAGFVVCAAVDASLISGLMNQVEEHDQHIWENILQRNRFALPLQIFLGALGAGFVAASSASSVPPWVSLALAGVLTAPLALQIRSSMRSAIDELVVQDQEELENELRRLRHEVKRQSESQEGLSEDISRKSQELNTIYDLARSLGASTNLSETTNLVKSMISRLRIPYQSCVIFLSKPGGGLDPTLAETPYQEVLGMSGLLQLQEPFILQVLRDPRPYMNNEVSPTTSEQRIFKDERSILIVPLMVNKENVGIIYLGSVNPKTHKEEHLEKLKMLAAFAAPSIKTALLFEHQKMDLESTNETLRAVEAKNHQLNGLQKLGAAIGTSLKIENTFKVVAENLKQMIPAAQSVILFGVSQTENHVLKAEYIHSPYLDFVRGVAVRNDEGILGKATEMNRTLLVQDTEKIDLQNLINNERAVIVAPLKAEEEILGLLYVGAAKERAFSEEARSLVETVSYQASIAIKNARLYEQTQQMAFTDGLTGLYLHRFFQVRLNEEIAWADRYKKSICLVMVDADKFKEFNDTLGHPAGDALLIEIAALLKDKVRSTDIVCRYGGDEFALILKDTPKDEAVRTCERIRETFLMRFGTNVVQVTSSIGLACYPTDATNKAELAKAADDALYVSKRSGRNRVTAAPTLEEKKYLPEVVQETLPR